MEFYLEESDRDLENKFKSLDSEIDNGKISENLQNFFYENMLPFYKESLENLNKYNLFVSARAMGKTTNVIYMCLYLALSTQTNIFVMRKTANSNENSIYPEFLEKIIRALNYLELDEKKHISYKKEKITLLLEEPISILFEGSYRPEKIKGINGYGIVLTEETQQFSQHDFQIVFPTFRNATKPVKFFCMANIPRQGKRNFLYEIFIKSPLPSYSYFQPQWKDNPAFFKTEDYWSSWVNDNKPLFFNKDNAFKREILGEWTEAENILFPKINELSDPNKATIWIYTNYAGVNYWLGIYQRIGENKFIVVEEKFGDPPLGIKEATTYIENKDIKKPISHLIGWTHYVKPATNDKLSTYFTYNELSINSDCLYALEEAKNAEWDTEEGFNIVGRSVKNDIKGLFVQAIRYAVTIFT